MKHELVDSGSSHNILTREAIIGLEIDVSKLKKVVITLVRIGGKPVKEEGSVKLPTTLKDKVCKKIVRQFFTVAKIDTPYNVIFERPLFNKLSVIILPKYLLMKFETNKYVASIRSDHMEA